MPTSRNILLIESGTTGGGSFVSLYQHLQAINREAFHPIVVYLNKNHFVRKVRQLGIPAYVFTDYLYSQHSPRYVNDLLKRIAGRIDRHAPHCYLEFARIAHFPLVRRLEKLVNNAKIDMIHLNGQTNRDLFGLFLAERTGISCISHLRSMGSLGFEESRGKYANKIVSVYIANSAGTKKYWVGKGLDPSKIKVVYNAIPDEPIEAVDIRKTCGLGENVKTIFGCIGKFTEAKGHRFLLRSFSRLRNKLFGTVLLLIGDGHLKNAIVDEAIKLGIDDSVFFLGYQEKVRGIIAGLDVLVAPSKSEGFGRVIIEAMQSGIPVVATKSGGIPEIVGDEYNGLLVEYGDERGLREAMVRLIEDNTLRSKLVKNGYKTVREKFNMEHYKSELELIYRGLTHNEIDSGVSFNNRFTKM